MDETLARRAHSVLAKAMELDHPEREAFVRASCAGDMEMQRRLGKLLAAIHQSSTFLEVPALGERNSTVPPSVPQAINGYRIERAIGVGGMATVYEAIQDQPRRRVALKVMRHGLTHTSALQRFQFETEVLARLHHPGIAQIFEAGAYVSGHGVSTPFFAMEYIEDALPITDYVQSRGLDLNTLLEMFVTVCDAVQHGHQLGVIHRDLKPANILVDAKGNPRVIDFGVARSSDPQQARITLHSDMGQLIGTLHYMSPEQCGDDGAIGIRTDVYSLGVLLYELLCRRLPHDFSRTAIPEALRIIHDEIPVPPSAHVPQLRGDIDAIVMKAIDKVPDRRYPTAAALAADILRFLRHETIEARPPTMIYRCRLFVRRHRALVGAVAAIMLTIIAGAVLSTRFAYQAIQESQRRLVAERQALAERDASRWQAYIANIAGAFAAHQTHEYHQMRSRLAATVPEHRGWEWHFLSGLADRSRQTIDAHQKMIEAFDVSSDGARLATGSRDGSLRLWDARTGLLVTEIDASPGAEVFSIAFDPDGTRIVSGSEDGSVFIWDAKVGTSLCLLGFHQAPVERVSWGQGDMIATADSEGEARLWDAGACELVDSLTQPGGTHGVGFSNDGSQLLTWNSNGEIRLRMSGAAEPCRIWQFGEKLQTVIISDDHTLVAAGGAEGWIKIWNAEDGALLYAGALESNPSTVWSLAFSHGGNYLAIGLINRSIIIWSLADSAVYSQLRGHGEAVVGLWFTPNDKTLVSVSRDKTIRIWGVDPSTATGLISTLRGHKDHLLAIAISPNGAVVASAGRDDVVRLWDPELNVPLGVLRGHADDIYGLAFSPDDRFIASASSDQTVRIWDARTGKHLKVLQHEGLMWSVAFSPDGNRLVSAGADGLIRIWEVPSFELTGILRGHPSRVNHVAFSPDGRLLASGSRDSTVRIWNMETGQSQFVLTRHQSDVMAVAFSRDGRWLFTGSRDQTVRVWNAQTGAQVKVLGGHGQLVTSLSVSPDGTRLAAGSWFGEIVLWDLATYDIVASFKGHDMAIRSLAFAPNGRWIATASHDQTVKLLEGATSSERILLRDLAQVHFESAIEYADRHLATSAAPDDHLSALDADTTLNPALKNSIRKVLLTRSLGAEPQE